MKFALSGIACLFYILPCIVYAQEPSEPLGQTATIPSSFIDKIQANAAKLNRRLTRQTERYVAKMKNSEAGLKKELYKMDSNATKNLFLSDPRQQYDSLLSKFRSGRPSGLKNSTQTSYLPYADSLQGSLTFLSKNPQLLKGSGAANIQPGLDDINQLQNKLQAADQIKQYVRERKAQIKAYLLQFAHLPPGVSTIYSDYNKDLYYLGQQLNTYKELLNNPDQLLIKTLSVLDQVPSFQVFMKSNSILSALIPSPSPGASLPDASGLQTKAQISDIVQARLTSSNAASVLSQNAADGESALGQLRDKVMKNGSSGSDVDMPDFKPNNLKTKTIWQRLEYGTNLQTQHSNYFVPTTTDLGLSVGYRISEKNTIGLGASYKFGWGQDIKHINMSSQGASLRSFLEVMIKSGFSADGGFEYNYQPVSNAHFTDFNPADWQSSGLIGVGKTISTHSSVFKKTKLQVLWDFLSYEQIPRTNPIKFRIGYEF